MDEFMIGDKSEECGTRPGGMRKQDSYRLRISTGNGKGRACTIVREGYTLSDKWAYCYRSAKINQLEEIKSRKFFRESFFVWLHPPFTVASYKLVS